MVVGIHGELRSGKDTIAKIITEHYGERSYRKAHADALKHIASILTGVPFEGFFEEEVKNTFCPLYGMSYGEVLQQLGTNVLRAWDQDIWVKTLYADYSEDRILVVPDVRFPNEAQKVRNMDGILVKVIGDPTGMNKESKRDRNHASETAMREWSDWDFVIHNDGTLEDLKAKVKSVIEHVDSKMSTAAV